MRKSLRMHLFLIPSIVILGCLPTTDDESGMPQYHGGHSDFGTSSAVSLGASSDGTPTSSSFATSMAESTSGTTSFSGGVSSSHETSSGAASLGGSSSGTQCGLKPEEGTCSYTRDCDCGLDCISGLCLKPCTTPESRDNCSATQLCTNVVKSGTGAINVCLTAVAKDQSCASPRRCAAGLSCQSDVDRQNNVIESTMACHTSCNYSANNTGCNSPEQCLPVTDDLHELQNDGVACNLDGGTECNAELGYFCGATGINEMPAACVRRIAACGTAVDNVQLWEADGGRHELTTEELCNHGPDENVPVTGGSIPVKGSRFCNPHQELDNPPFRTYCLPALARGYNSGACIGVCYLPSNGEYPDSDYDCAPDAFCEKEAYCDWPVYGPMQSGEFISCENDTQCPTGSGCCHRSSGSICITKTGICSRGPRRPRPATSSSSSRPSSSSSSRPSSSRPSSSSGSRPSSSSGSRPTSSTPTSSTPTSDDGTSSTPTSDDGTSSTPPSTSCDDTSCE